MSFENTNNNIRDISKMAEKGEEISINSVLTMVNILFDDVINVNKTAKSLDDFKVDQNDVEDYFVQARDALYVLISLIEKNMGTLVKPFWQDDMTELLADAKECQERLTQMETDYNEKKGEYDKLKKKDEEIKELDRSIRELKANTESIDEKKKELEILKNSNPDDAGFLTKYACLSTAFNSLQIDGTVENIFDDSGDNPEVTPEGTDLELINEKFKNIGDVIEWSDEVQKRIEGLLSGYMERYNGILKLIEKTEESKDTDE